MILPTYQNRRAFLKKLGLGLGSSLLANASFWNSNSIVFDVYHIQIMDEDLIRHIQQYQELIGHVQVAGVPGRGEIGTNQEINYRAIMKAFLDIGYSGYVGHEWIPKGDPMKGLKEALLFVIYSRPQRNVNSTQSI